MIGSILASIWTFIKPQAHKYLTTGFAALVVWLQDYIPGFTLDVDALVVIVVGIVGTLLSKLVQTQLNPANAATPALTAKGQLDQVKAAK